MGVVAEQDGLFRAAGSALARLPLGGRALLVVALGLVALVTAVLNLDTSVFFLTPVLVHLARRRDLDERGFLYGAVFMSSSASVTGSLSALLWLRVARSLGCHPSVRLYSLIGVVLVPVSLAAALAASYG